MVFSCFVGEEGDGVGVGPQREKYYVSSVLAYFGDRTVLGVKILFFHFAWDALEIDAAVARWQPLIRAAK